jgi:hypothetical protein
MSQRKLRNSSFGKRHLEGGNVKRENWKGREKKEMRSESRIMLGRKVYLCLSGIKSYY